VARSECKLCSLCASPCQEISEVMMGHRFSPGSRWILRPSEPPRVFILSGSFVDACLKSISAEVPDQLNLPPRVGTSRPEVIHASQPAFNFSHTFGKMGEFRCVPSPDRDVMSVHDTASVSLTTNVYRRYYIILHQLRGSARLTALPRTLITHPCLCPHTRTQGTVG